MRGRLAAGVGFSRGGLADLLLEPGVSAEALLARADAAMYRAKEQGRDRYQVY